MAYKYDVFISYSRKDYTDENKNIIPGNVISTIKEQFDKNGISYWMDEKGDMTGKKFAAIIAKQITDSNVFLFVCSQNSVASKWVDRELGVADDREKHIIPFACDESYRDDKVIMFTGSHDRIDYFMNPEKEMKKLIDHILKKKAEAEKEAEIMRQREEEEKKKREEEERKKAILEEISTLKLQLNLSNIQQSDIIGQLNKKFKSIGRLQIKCPVCGKSCSLDALFCDRCGFQFPPLYSIDENAASSIDPKLLLIHKSVWNGAKVITQLETTINELKVDNSSLRANIDEYEKKLAELGTSLASQKDLIHVLRKENTQLKKSEEESHKVLSEYELVINRVKAELKETKQKLLLNEETLKAKESELAVKTQQCQRIEKENKNLRNQNNQVNSGIKQQKKEVSNESFRVNGQFGLSVLELVKQSSRKELLKPSDKVVGSIDTSLLSIVLKRELGLVLSNEDIKACPNIDTLLKMINNVYWLENGNGPHNSASRTAKARSKSIPLSMGEIDLILLECQKPSFLRGIFSSPASVHNIQDINLSKLSNRLSAEYKVDISVDELNACNDIKTLRKLIYNISRL